MTYSCEHTILLFVVLTASETLLEVWSWLDFARLADFASCKIGQHFMMASLLRKSIDRSVQRYIGNECEKIEKLNEKIEFKS